MKKVSVVIAFLFAVFMGIIQFFMVGFNNLYIITMLFIINIAISIWMAIRINNYLSIIDNYTTCYNFVNSFIVSLSVTKSISGALQQCLLGCDKHILKDLEGVSQMEDLDKVKYLKKTFNNNYYYQFLQVLNCFLNQGGDILKSSKFLLKSGQNDQEYIDGCRKNVIKKLIGICSLWFLIIILLIGLKFGVLSNFQSLIKSNTYMLLMAGFYLFVDASIYVSVNRMTMIDIPGIKKYEKNKKILRKN